MCYGMGCKYESTYYGPNCGECRKPSGAICPEYLITCKGCREDFEEKEVNEFDYCEDCAQDIADEKEDLLADINYDIEQFKKGIK